MSKVVSRTPEEWMNEARQNYAYIDSLYTALKRVNTYYHREIELAEMRAEEALLEAQSASLRELEGQT